MDQELDSLMHYCETCREENGWAYCRQKITTCDICGTEGTCYCGQAGYLLMREHVNLTSALTWAEMIAGRVGEQRRHGDLPVVETHLIMSQVIMEAQLEALALRRNPDFITALYELESMKELRLQVQQLSERVDKEREYRKAQKTLHEKYNLDRAYRHWKTAFYVVGLMRSLAHLCHAELDDASIRFSLLELA